MGFSRFSCTCLFYPFRLLGKGNSIFQKMRNPRAYELLEGVVRKIIKLERFELGSFKLERSILS